MNLSARLGGDEFVRQYLTLGDGLRPLTNPCTRQGRARTAVAVQRPGGRVGSGRSTELPLEPLSPEGPTPHPVGTARTPWTGDSNPEGLIYSMSFQYRAIEDGRVLLVRATGEADPADWLNLPEEAAVIIDQDRCCGILIDLRRQTTLPSSTTARAIGRELGPLAGRFGGVALVAKPGAQFGLARMTELIATLHDVPVVTFGCPRQALRWVVEREHLA